jgi:hypothetical protein
LFDLHVVDGVCTLDYLLSMSENAGELPPFHMKERVPMKIISLLLALTVTFIALPGVLAYADASKEGCEHSGGKAAGCSNDPVSAPEPSIFALLTLGLAAAGGVVLVFGRRREAQN